ncbi:MAG: phosphatase PAP2 family protein [Bacteroidota bacterium]
MKQFTNFVFLLLISLSPIFSQTDTLSVQKDLKEKTFLKKSIIPLSLIGSGLLINYSNGSFGKENLQEKIQNNFEDFHTNIDNLTWFAPAIIMYSADLMKIESKNDAFTQTKYLTIAGLANNILTYGIKRITDEQRPNGEDFSFPSQHTSNAFVMATVLHHEFAETNPVIAYSGYFFATTTGVLRVLNNKHWVSDVLVGAGLGIIVTDLVYRFEPLKNWNPFKNKKTQVFMSPSFNNQQYGIYANLRF